MEWRRSVVIGLRLPGGTRPPDAFALAEFKPPRPATAFHRRAYTLLELLVVLAIVAVFSYSLAGGPGTGRSAALQSGQALLADLVTAARSTAMAGGQSARILIHVDPAGQPTRYLRSLVVQAQVPAGWQTQFSVTLPGGVFVVPGNFTALPAGLFATGLPVPWTKVDGSPLRSTALRSNQIIVEAIDAAPAERWVGITISANPGTVQSGDLILAAGRMRAPGSYAPGESPVELTNPETVRGLTLSAYAVPILINARTGF